MIAPVKITVRFSDLDPVGHVHNSIYLTYFEMARVHYFAQVLRSDYNWTEYGFVVVKNEVEYLKPIFLHDDVIVSMSVDNIGTKSITFSYILRVGEAIHAKGSSVLVAYNSRTHLSIPVPDEMRDALDRLKAEQ